jgi:preprotein translocase subunit SecE
VVLIFEGLSYLRRACLSQALPVVGEYVGPSGKKMATQQVETVSTGADKAKLAVAVLLLVGAVVGFYLLAKQAPAAQWAALLVGLGAAFAVFATSELGKQFLAFGRDAWNEAKKVVWPARKEAMQMTAYVFAFVVAMAIFLWVTDKALEWVIFDKFLGWRK